MDDRKTYTALVAVTRVDEMYVNIKAASLEQARLAFDALVESGDEDLFETILDSCDHSEDSIEANIEGEVTRSSDITMPPDEVTPERIVIYPRLRGEVNSYVQEFVDEWIKDNEED
jgi:hypothetical protein